MVDKVRPLASVGWSEGNDGRDAHETIELKCPKCKKLFAIVGTRYKDIRTAYNLSECCKECGAIFDWSKAPIVKTTTFIEWE